MPELYERDHHVQEMLAAAEAGQSSVVLVTGEAGIGKTSVVRAFLDRLPPDVRTLWGACDDLLAPPALGPFRDAFRGSGGPLEQALATGGTDAVFDALTTELAPGTTVLVVEDVHWADDTTLDVLRSRGTQASTRNNPGGLTARQLDVLVLLAEGLTNAEIAGRLVVSVRTVDHHVSAILGKLGAQTRREAAATADSLGVA